MPRAIIHLCKQASLLNEVRIFSSTSHLFSNINLLVEHFYNQRNVKGASISSLGRKNIDATGRKRNDFTGAKRKLEISQWQALWKHESRFQNVNRYAYFYTSDLKYQIYGNIVRTWCEVYECTARWIKRLTYFDKNRNELNAKLAVIISLNVQMWQCYPAYQCEVKS